MDIQINYIYSLNTNKSHQTMGDSPKTISGQWAFFPQSFSLCWLPHTALLSPEVSQSILTSAWRLCCFDKEVRHAKDLFLIIMRFVLNNGGVVPSKLNNVHVSEKSPWILD